MQFALIEQALQAPVMDAVIALTERFQDLEAKPSAIGITFLRGIDQSLAIGYSEELSSIQSDFEARGFQLVEARRGTRREERLLLLDVQLEAPLVGKLRRRRAAGERQAHVEAAGDARAVRRLPVFGGDELSR